MEMSLLRMVTALFAACSRRLRPQPISLFRRRSKKRIGEESSVAMITEAEYGGAEEMEGVWRREILLGERCQPLEFSGVIHYDADGRRLPDNYAPRSPMRSRLPSFSFHPVVIGTGGC